MEAASHHANRSGCFRCRSLHAQVGSRRFEQLDCRSDQRFAASFGRWSWSPHIRVDFEVSRCHVTHDGGCQQGWELVWFARRACGRGSEPGPKEQLLEDVVFDPVTSRRPRWTVQVTSQSCRFMVLSSESHDEAPISEPVWRIVSVARACPAPPDAFDHGRTAVPVRPSAPTTLRLMTRDVARLSQATTFPTHMQLDLVVLPEPGVREVRLDVDDTEVEDQGRSREGLGRNADSDEARPTHRAWPQCGGVSR